VLTTTDPKGVTTTNTYDAKGNLLSTATPIGTNVAKTTYTYGDSAHPGDVTAVTDPLGKAWTYAYSANGDRAGVTDPLGHITTSTYDTLGRLLSLTTPLSHTTSYTYDALGDLLTTTDPLGHKTTRTYDKNQNLVSVKDANGNTTTLTYDKDNELTKQVRTSSTSVVVQTLNIAYDANGNAVKHIDGLGHATTYTYDALNRKTSAADPLGRKTTYHYDKAGNLTVLVDPSTRTTSYTYDAANQLKKLTYSDGTTPTVSYTYDKDGQRVSMTDGTGTTTTTYNALHRLTKNTNGAGAAVSYGHDLRGDLTSITYPGGTTAARSYDAAGRLVSVTDWLTHKTRFAYDADGNLISEAYPNGVAATLTYDNADRLTSVADTHGTNHLLSLTYTRDPVGLLTSENTTNYTYDPLNRVTAAGSASYGYDAANSPTSFAGATQTFDAASQLTQQVAAGVTTTYTYNAEGSRTSQTPTSGPAATLTYNQANQLTSYASGTTTATYVYNGDGLRMTKTINSGTPEAFTWDTAEGLPLIIQDGTTNYVTGPGGLPLEQVSSSTVHYLQHDQLGSTRLLTDASGLVVNSYTYPAYGTRHATGGGNTPTTPFGYAGQYTDAESGLVYLRARYYDPATAEFITLDPFVAGTRQPYTYALDSPTNLTDNSGADVCDNGNWGDLVLACKEVLYCGSVSDCIGVANDLEAAQQQLVDDLVNNGSDCQKVAHDRHDLQLINQAALVLTMIQLPHFGESHWTSPIYQHLCQTAEVFGGLGAGLAAAPGAATYAVAGGSTGLGVAEAWNHGPCS
jgi:RHS repeat-associated protein